MILPDKLRGLNCLSGAGEVQGPKSKSCSVSDFSTCFHLKDYNDLPVFQWKERCKDLRVVQCQTLAHVFTSKITMTYLSFSGGSRART